MNLQYYPVVKIQDGSAEVVKAFNARQMSCIEQAQIITRLKFRDTEGKYWFYDLYEEDWYYFEKDEWLLTSEPPAVLEGQAQLFSAAEELSDRPAGSLEDATVVVRRSAHHTLEDSLRKIKEEYLAGWLSSADAELIAMRHYLIDQQGLFWTVGLESGEWYWNGEPDWEKSSSPPPEEQLLTLTGGDRCRECEETLNQAVICPACGADNLLELPDLAEDVYERILEFLIGGGSVPEWITPAWDPPDSFPGRIRNQYVRK